MKKIFILLLLIFLVAGLLQWQKNQPSGSFEVISNDGNVKLALSREALPRGIESNAIKVTKINSDQTAVYKLEPDGLVLSKPAIIEISFNNAENKIPLLLHSSGAGPLPLTDVLVTKVAGQKTKITAKLSRFSFIFLAPIKIKVNLTAMLANSRSSFVQYPLSVSALIDSIGAINTIDLKTTIEGKRWEISHMSPPFMVEGVIYAEKQLEDVFQPTKIEAKPVSTDVSYKERLYETATFRCVKPQKSVYLNYDVTLSGKVKMFIFPYEQEKVNKQTTTEIVYPIEETIRITSNRFDCEEAATPLNTPATRIDTSQKTSGDQDAGQVPLVPMEVLIINGQNFPALQFRVAPPDACNSSHYHADYEVSTVDLKNHINDPNPDGCGFGKVTDIIKKTISVPKAQADTWK